MHLDDSLRKPVRENSQSILNKHSGNLSLKKQAEFRFSTFSQKKTHNRYLIKNNPKIYFWGVQKTSKLDLDWSILINKIIQKKKKN